MPGMGDLREAEAEQEKPAGMGDLQKLEEKQANTAFGPFSFEKKAPSTVEIDPLTGQPYLRNNTTIENDPLKIGYGAPIVELPSPTGGLAAAKPSASPLKNDAAKPASPVSQAITSLQGVDRAERESGPAMDSLPNPVVGEAPSAPSVAEAPVSVAPVTSQAPTKPEEKKGFDWKKLGEMAKKMGVGILDLIQAGAYGYTGRDKETRLEAQTAADAKAAAAKNEREWQEKMTQEEAARRAAEQAQAQAWQQQMAEVQAAHDARKSEIEHNFQTALASAKNDWDTQAAERAYQVQTGENEKDRQANKELAAGKAAAAAGQPLSKADALAAITEQIRKMYGGN